MLRDEVALPLTLLSERLKNMAEVPEALVLERATSTPVEAFLMLEELGKEMEEVADSLVDTLKGLHTMIGSDLAGEMRAYREQQTEGITRMLRHFSPDMTELEIRLAVTRQLGDEAEMREAFTRLFAPQEAPTGAEETQKAA